MTRKTNLQKILIVDDDIALQSFLGEYLSKNGYETQATHKGESIKKQLKQHSFALIILDIVLPGKDGFFWLNWLRQTYPAIKVLMLSVKGDVDDRIHGLESGANDYLPKPFSPRELLARVNNILDQTQSVDSSISFGDYKFNLQSYTLTKNTKTISLTTSEASLLKHLCTNRFTTVTRDQLSQVLRGAELDPMDRSVDVHIFNLRNKLEKTPSKPKFICTVWGKGYRFHPS